MYGEYIDDKNLFTNNQCHAYVGINRDLCKSGATT